MSWLPSQQTQAKESCRGKGKAHGCALSGFRAIRGEQLEAITKATNFHLGKNSKNWPETDCRKQSRGHSGLARITDHKARDSGSPALGQVVLL